MLEDEDLIDKNGLPKPILKPAPIKNNSNITPKAKKNNGNKAPLAPVAKPRARLDLLLQSSNP